MEPEICVSNKLPGDVAAAGLLLLHGLSFPNCPHGRREPPCEACLARIVGKCRRVGRAVSLGVMWPCGHQWAGALLRREAGWAAAGCGPQQDPRRCLHVTPASLATPGPQFPYRPRLAVAPQASWGGGVKRHKHSLEKQLNPIIKRNYFSKPVKQRQ